MDTDTYRPIGYGNGYGYVWTGRIRMQIDTVIETGTNTALCTALALGSPVGGDVGEEKLSPSSSSSSSRLGFPIVTRQAS